MSFFGALLLRVVFERSLVSLFWAILVAVFYGSLFYILIPSEAYSWQGHLFGFIGGVVAAAILGICWRRNKSRSENDRDESNENDLGVFDDLKLGDGIDRLASEEIMMNEVQQAYGT